MGVVFIIHHFVNTCKVIIIKRCTNFKIINYVFPSCTLINRGWQLPCVDVADQCLNFLFPVNKTSTWKICARRMLCSFPYLYPAMMTQASSVEGQSLNMWQRTGLAAASTPLLARILPPSQFRVMSANSSFWRQSYNPLSIQRPRPLALINTLVLFMIVQHCDRTEIT